ncbi:hypothetical protein GOODEAATRI_014123, partial [Goodea atripinnis]
YNAVIEACSLQPDIDILPQGDQTEIGERGIILSGGQKQRISVARALYQQTHVVFLDDPFSALDIHLSDHLMQDGILKLLREEKRTVVLVTHKLQYLPQADWVTQQWLLSFKHFIDRTSPRYLSSETVAESMTDLERKNLRRAMYSREALRTEEDEEACLSLEGNDMQPHAPMLAACDVLYLLYIVGGEMAGAHSLASYPPMGMSICLEIDTSSDTSVTAYPVDKCVSVSQDCGFSHSWYLSVFSVLCCLGIVLCLATSVTVEWTGLKVAKELHHNLLNKIILAPMRYNTYSVSLNAGLPQTR